MTNDQKEIIDIDEAKIMAALSYLGVLVFVPLLVLMRKEDPFVRWHVKQGLVLLAGIVIALLAAAWIPVVGNILFLLLLIVNIIALVQTLLGKRWVIPVIGQLAEKFRI